MSDITIFHTNDLHGKFRPELAETIIAERAKAGCSMLVDAGDAVSSGNIYFRPGGEPVMAKMTELGYDAMTMGNREFHFMECGLKSKVRLADFPVLCGNLRAKNDKTVSSVGESVFFDLSGLRVGVLGLSVPMIRKGMTAEKLSPFWFEDPIDTAEVLVPVLRKDSDVLIALTHIGLKRDMELAERVSGIDLIVGGHSHDLLNDLIMVGNTAIAQAGWWGNCFGRVDISLSGSKGRPEITGEIIEVCARK